MISKYLVLTDTPDSFRVGKRVISRHKNLLGICTTKELHKLTFCGSIKSVYIYTSISSKKVKCPCEKRLVCSLGEDEDL